MQISERCNRIHLINLLEEEDLCKLCQYCKFLDKLRDALNRSLFFTLNAHINLWVLGLKIINLKLFRFFRWNYSKAKF